MRRVKRRAKSKSMSMQRAMQRAKCDASGAEFKSCFDCSSPWRAFTRRVQARHSESLRVTPLRRIPATSRRVGIAPARIATRAPRCTDHSTWWSRCGASAEKAEMIAPGHPCTVVRPCTAVRVHQRSGEEPPKRAVYGLSGSARFGPPRCGRGSTAEQRGLASNHGCS